MDIKITPSPLKGTTAAISSKSDVHRLLIASALSESATAIYLNIMSDDIKATIRCLRQLGAEITEENSCVKVSPICEVDRFTSGVDCGESGTTARFMLPLVAALYGKGTITGHGHLPNRPFSPLIDAMNKNSCVVSKVFPFEIKSPLKSGVYEIPGDVSSQFISALLIALPLLDGDSEIHLTNPLQSLGYVDMTLSTSKTFGITVLNTEKGYFVPGRQKYRSPGTVIAEGDWSNAAFWLCGGIIGQGVNLTGLKADSTQGDSAVVDILQRFGAKITVDTKSVKAFPNKLRGIEIDATDIPDLVPVLASLSAFAKGTTVIKNVSRLRIKESDRLLAIVENLSVLGADIVEQNDSLIVKYKLPKGGCRVSGYNDHRIVMSTAIVASVCDEPVIIVGAEAVDKSYPGFFEEFKKMGGIAHVI